MRRPFWPAAVCLLACACAGTNTTTEQTYPETEWSNAQEIAEAKWAADQKKLLVDLKRDPQPIFDLAVKRVKDALPESIGDEAAATAVVTVDKSSLKTFGPEKWKVRGTFRGTVDGKPLKTVWEVEVRAISGELEAGFADLDVFIPD